MGKLIDITGNKYSRWTVLSYSGKERWKCVCECGATRDVIKGSLVSGKSLSCGCFKIERVKEASTIHGHAGKNCSHNTRTYNTWKDMRRRCVDKNHKNHKTYYDKGIKVCEEWENFVNFLEDMGVRPEGKTIDRIDSDKGYYKENCRWATPKEQANNMSRNHYLEYDGERLTISQWADKLGISYNKLNTRIHRGWSVKRALTTK